MNQTQWKEETAKGVQVLLERLKKVEAAPAPKWQEETVEEIGRLQERLKKVAAQ